MVFYWLQLEPEYVFMCFYVCSECADIMTGGSRRCIVVSTLAEATFYADRGYDDILYAYSIPFDKVLLSYLKSGLLNFQ